MKHRTWSRAAAVRAAGGGLRKLAALALLTTMCAGGRGEVLTLAPDERPGWLARDGIVMAGSWEPLYFRVRRDGAPGYTPTAEQLAAYRREHSPEMLARLKAAGVNFVMMHCNKGGGLEAERESMADAVRFAKLCREHGLRVGTYVSSATLLWELFFQEVPEAKDWVLLGPDGRPRTYGRATYRYFWNRNHPDAAAYHRRIVEYAISEIRADLIHCDNYVAGPGHDPCSIDRFRRYLADTFDAQERAGMGAERLDTVQPPGDRSPALLQYAWREFCCRSLADSFCELTRWARTQRRDILMECNPAGPRRWITPPLDHGRLLQGGDAFWDEGTRPGYDKGALRTRIPTYKVARRMGNMAFTYTHTPLEMAESMAFNRDCLGCVCFFEYGEPFRHRRAGALLDPAVASSIRFFHNRRDLLRDADPIADVAVLRSFPSQVFAGAPAAQLTHRIEEALIAGRVCFQILYDHHLADLGRYRVLVLAGCVAMDDLHAEQIRRFVLAGGRLCVVGPLATHDAWNRPRAQPSLDDLPAAAVVRVSPEEDPLLAVRRACGGGFTLEVDAPHGLCSELTAQPTRHIVHLVNYRGDQPARDVRVRVRLPAGRRATSVTLAGPDHPEDRPAPFRVADGALTFVVPQVGVYEVAALKWE